MRRTNEIACPLNLVQPPQSVPGREMPTEQVAYKGHQHRTGARAPDNECSEECSIMLGENLLKNTFFFF